MDRDCAIIRSSHSLLLDILEVVRNGDRHSSPSHYLCKKCGKKSLSVFPKESGEWGYHCHSCSRAGSSIDALIQYHDVADEAASIQQCKSRLGLDSSNAEKIRTQIKVEAKITALQTRHKGEPPDIDLGIAEPFIEKYNKFLLKDEECYKNYALHKRGITADTIAKYRLGFISNTRIFWINKRFEESQWLIPAAWVLPVTDPSGKLMAIKLHFEVAPDGFNMKSVWARFSKNGQNGYQALWPHLNSQTQFEGVNFSDSEDLAWWLQRIPDGKVKDRWFEKIEHNKWNFSPDLKVHPDDYTPDHYQFIYEKTFEEMRQEIREVVLENNDVVDPIHYQLREFAFLVPGELKALAMISDGLNATAPTYGENSFNPTQEMLSCFCGRRVAIMYDDDAPRLVPGSTDKYECAGRNFVHRMVPRIKEAGATDIRIFTAGGKLNESGK